MTGETVHYAAPERDHTVLLFRAQRTQRLNIDLQIGDLLALYCTSRWVAGKLHHAGNIRLGSGTR
jgi:DNA-binding IclR family transcriptional regulator